jgi:hypothetical protein
MLTFGTSSYLKLNALNTKPRDTYLRTRVLPSTGGYDFHKVMRRITGSYITGKITIADALAEANLIQQAAEKKSAMNAISQIDKWKVGLNLLPVKFTDISVKSPSEQFAVKFSADLILEEQGALFAVHLWNNQTPPLNLRGAESTMGLFVGLIPDAAPAVLCLRTLTLYKMKDIAKSIQFAQVVARDVEMRIEEIKSKLPGYTKPDKGIQPSA